MRREELEQTVTYCFQHIVLKWFIRPQFVEITEVTGIDYKDYPDFVDAYVLSAWCKPLNRALTEEEIEYYHNNYSDVVYEHVLKQAF